MAILDSMIFRFTFAVTNAIACVLRAISVLLLFETDSFYDKVDAIAMSNVLTSIILGVFTKASRTDVFMILTA